MPTTINPPADGPILDQGLAERVNPTERSPNRSPSESHGRLEAVKAAVPPVGFEMICLADVEPEEVDWLWPGRVARGKITMISGDPGLGKSTVTLDMAATVTTGRPWPDAPGVPTQVGSVILLSAEDGLADTIRPRLDYAGAEPGRVFALTMIRQVNGTRTTPNLKKDLAQLEEAILKAGNVSLVIIDPVSAYTSGIDDHKNGDVRGMLAPLAEMAERLGIAVVLVSHLNKNVGGKSTHRSIGSIAFVAAARTAWLICQDPENPNRRLMLRSKNNLSALDTGLAFKIVDGSIRWESAPVYMNADQALAAEERAPNREKKEETASKFLRELLADGPMQVNEIFKLGGEADICEGRLRRARVKANIPHKHHGFGPGSYWTWGSPQGASTDPEPDQPGELGIYDAYGREDLDGADGERAA